jgi:hypothetical protein
MLRKDRIMVAEEPAGMIDATGIVGLGFVGY